MAQFPSLPSTDNPYVSAASSAWQASRDAKAAAGPKKPKAAKAKTPKGTPAQSPGSLIDRLNRSASRMPGT